MGRSIISIQTCRSRKEGGVVFRRLAVWWFGRTGLVLKPRTDGA